jgi:hypothetical protein
LVFPGTVKLYLPSASVTSLDIVGAVFKLTDLDCDVESVTYNPYKYKTFVDKKTGRAVKVSDYAVLTCGNGWQDVEGIWS